jgi:hypothetical protein
MRLHEDEVAMIQIYGAKRQVFAKLHKYKHMSDILESTQREGESRHNRGEKSVVRIQDAGLGTKRVRFTNIPPEVSDSVLKAALERYGQVKGIHADTWSQGYHYPVDNGIREAMVTLVAHIPSHLMVAGHRSLVSYESQPPTCYGCNNTSHVYIEYPKRKKVEVVRRDRRTTAWAEVTEMDRGAAVKDPTGSSEGFVELERRNVEIGRDDGATEEIVIVHHDSK